MPKERSHWLLARQVVDRLTPGPLADAVLAYEEFLYAGAVAHDSPYYVMDDKAAQRVADRLHGTHGHDPYEPFRTLATYRQALGAPAFAFGLGALTHLAADVTFHPIVFSWTGDLSASDPELSRGWRYRHHACETALDLHLEALWGRAPLRSYRRNARKAGVQLIAVQGAWAQGDARPWIQAHGRLQGLFGHRVLGALARGLAWKDRRGDTDLSAAFYPGRPVRHPAFEGTLEWIDPVTGAPGRARLEQLVERFEAFAADLAAEWQSAWLEGREPFAGAVGPALDTAIPADRDQTKRHFQPRWF